MLSTTDAMIADVRQEFERLIAQVTGPESQHLRAEEAELGLFRSMQVLGGRLLQLFFDSRAAAPAVEPVLRPDETVLHRHDWRSRRYVSVFGTQVIRRQAYHAPGQPVCCPLDAALSLPARCYSTLVRQWAAYGCAGGAYRETQDLLERMLNLRLSVQTLEDCLAEDACDLLAFDAQAEVPPADPAATILVAQADGKGVPIVRSTPLPRTARPSSGRPGGRMKEAIVTAVYTVAPYERSAAEIVALLLADDAEPDPAVALAPPPGWDTDRARPQPHAKQLRATLEGKTVALTRLAEAIQRRDGVHIQDRVALCDGAEALQDELRRVAPGHTLVLDSIHAVEYLWEAATALLGQRHPERLAWMRAQLTALLQGRSAQVIELLQAALDAGDLSVARQEALRSTLRYDRRNQPWMRYDQYLRAGWPIGTGIVEGACGYLVKQRLQGAGMRWTLAGAQAVLDLRAVRVGEEWDAYWRFHRQQQHQRRYGQPTPWALPVELQLLNEDLAA